MLLHFGWEKYHTLSSTSTYYFVCFNAFFVLLGCSFSVKSLTFYWKREELIFVFEEFLMLLHMIMEIRCIDLLLRYWFIYEEIKYIDSFCTCSHEIRIRRWKTFMCYASSSHDIKIGRSRTLILDILSSHDVRKWRSSTSILRTIITWHTSYINYDISLSKPAIW